MAIAIDSYDRASYFYFKKHTMYQFIRKVFKQITVLESVSAELAEAELSLLEAETAAEYADSIIVYRTAQITRLRSYLKKLKVNNA